MEEALKVKVDLMVDNFKKLKKAFKWESELIKHFVAMSHAINGKSVNVELLEEIKKHIKDHTGTFSSFRGTNAFVLAGLLSFEEDYAAFFENMVAVYEKMKVEGFKYSQYTPMAAYAIAKEVQVGDWGITIKKMKAFYELMKSNHFWLTSSDDYVFAAVLATSELEALATSQSIEECYNFLNSMGFSKGNDLQTLSHILVLGEETVSEKCKRANEIYKALKERKCKLKYSGLASLGVLTIIGVEAEKVAEEVKEVCDYIYKEDGYGLWHLDASMRALLATGIVADYYVDSVENGLMQITIGSSINAILIAQQQAAIIAACAAGAAAGAATSS